jgi:protein-S-isoprenylcysteine O-methyltransferase Ste14
MMRKITTRNTSVNVAKVVTILCLLALPLIYPVHTRQAAYLALQVSYCIWYLMKQAILREPVFRERDSLLDAIQVVAIVGVFYALPGWLAFTNPEPVGDAILAASIVLFFFGSVINSGADIQKTTTLRLREGLITDGFWRLSRNINYFGDVLRYSAFALLAGSIWAWAVPITVLAIDLGRMRKKETSLARLPGFEAYRSDVPALIPLVHPRFRRGATPVVGGVVEPPPLE